ncbi:putative quinol monooxygenase [Iodobacter fluviatilis]|uniref:Monooxygenase ycnE n=1 Tax=Iodobacter fluviatilis TaxID=537 RepID=A0A377Q6J4_9NEIS|nr:putative quinol monooxygenase [Iodobacter fluviatilis]TCU90424.1 quinol monooxygenase YgiN [Iodobacter fluviatilis]STQ89451.1 Putative monooxygenase ycnE [Iodobacter fluviatilis]
MSSPLFVLATIIAKPNHARQVSDAIQLVLAPSRQEEGCYRYDLLQDNSNDHRFVIQEQWQNKAALNAHMQTAHFKALVESIAPLANIDVAELNLLA